MTRASPHKGLVMDVLLETLQCGLSIESQYDPVVKASTSLGLTDARTAVAGSVAQL